METQELSKLRVLVTVIEQGWVRPEIFQVLNKMSQDPRVSLEIRFLRLRPYENALNTARKIVLDEGFDYLISFDHDNVPINNPIDIVFMGKDILGMPYIGTQTRGDVLETAFLAMDKQENGEYFDHKNTDGLQEVDAIASGAMVVSKKVLADIYFERFWKDGMATKGVDFYFCEKAKEKGHRVWAHYGYPASHFKEIDLYMIS